MRPNRLVAVVCIDVDNTAVSNIAMHEPPGHSSGKCSRRRRDARSSAQSPDPCLLVREVDLRIETQTNFNICTHFRAANLIGRLSLQIDCLRVVTPRPVSLLPLLLPRLVRLWLRPLDTKPGMAPLSGLSSASLAASMCSSRWDGKPPPP